MPRYFKTFFIAILVIISTKKAFAELQICNDTNSVIVVALGKQSAGEWSTSGWWRIAPMSCSSLIKQKLKSRYYYIHAEDGRSDEGRWEGPIFLCVKDKKFDIKGIRNCYVQGYQKAGFQEIDTQDHTSWTVHLSESNKTTDSSK